MTPPQARALLPPAVVAWSDRDEEWAAHVDALPTALARICGEWELEVDGPAGHGRGSVVLEVRAGPQGQAAVLKIVRVEPASEHEALALQRWGGRGAVRLLRADPRRAMFLLERLPGPDLSQMGDVEACEIVGGLYGDLHRPAPPQLDAVPDRLVGQLAELSALSRSAPLPRRLVEQAVALGTDLLADPASRGVLVHGDLHYAKVLARSSGEFAAIGARPASGDPHSELAPMLTHRWGEVTDSGDVRRAVRQRFHTLIDVAGLDEVRARGWVVVSMLLDAAAELRTATARSGPPDAARLTRCVAVAKAVQE